MERTLAFRLALVLIASAGGGCSMDAEGPRERLGSLPLPGIFSLYSAPDPEALGVHRYGRWGRLGERDEVGHGTVYTTRAGFLDLAHVREAIDCTRFGAENARKAGMTAGGRFSAHWSDAEFEATVRTPVWWSDVPDNERELLMDECAIRLGERLAVVMGTWHEAATWFGYETVPGISERGSAFTWDDATSHVVGAMIAGRVLRRGNVSKQSWDEAVTVEMQKMLDELGVVGCREQRRAAMSVCGTWWRGVEAVRRDVETGLADGVKRGWLVPEFDDSGSGVIELPVATFGDVLGRDCNGVYDLRIRPGWLMMYKLRAARVAEVNGEDGMDEQGLLRVVERVRSEVKDKWGEDADRP